MRSDRRGLTVLSLVIILIVVGLIAFFLLRSGGQSDPMATPASPPIDAAPTTADAGGRLTAVREPEPTAPAGGLDTVSVRLANSSGSPMIGIPLVFTAESGGGSVDALRVRTDSTGLAMTVWRFGGEPGPNSLRVTAEAPNTLVEPLILSITTFSP